MSTSAALSRVSRSVNLLVDMIPLVSGKRELCVEQASSGGSRCEQGARLWRDLPGKTGDLLHAGMFRPEHERGEMLFSGQVGDEAGPLGRRCAHWLVAFFGMKVSGLRCDGPDQLGDAWQAARVASCDDGRLVDPLVGSLQAIVGKIRGDRGGPAVSDRAGELEGARPLSSGPDLDRMRGRRTGQHPRK